jgi:hypothetical protein
MHAAMLSWPTGAARAHIGALLQVKVLNDPDTDKPVVVTYTGVVLYAESCMDDMGSMLLGFLTATYDVEASSWGMRLYVGGGEFGLAEITPDAAGGAGCPDGQHSHIICEPA